MINWSLLTPRNLFVIALISVISFGIFKHFSNGDS